jgi:hypothetical protein
VRPTGRVLRETGGDFLTGAWFPDADTLAILRTVTLHSLSRSSRVSTATRGLLGIFKSGHASRFASVTISGGWVCSTLPRYVQIASRCRRRGTGVLAPVLAL